MAEGGHLASLRDGSDSYFELCCTPCNEDNVREEAIKYCPECQEYLCLTCTRHHGRLKATRSHQLVGQDNAMPAGDASDCKDVIKSKCRYHPDRDIEIYCGSHDMVYCALCVAIGHRSCGGVIKIDSVTISECDGNIDALLAEIKEMHEQLIIASKKKEENLQCIAEQKETIHTCIQEAKRKLMEQLDVLERKSESLLHEKYSEIRDELESDISMIKIKISEVGKMIRSLESIPKTDAEHKFVQTKLSKTTVAEALQVLAKSESNGTKAMSFEENEALISSNIETETFGSIKILTTGNDYTKDKLLKMKSKSDINVSMQSDQYTCCITDVCLHQDGSIILVDCDNKKIKLLDLNYKLKADISVESDPLGVCCTDQNEVAVKLWNKVLFLSAGTSLSKIREIEVSSGSFYGLAYHNGELWLSADELLSIYNPAGKLLKSVQIDLSVYKINKFSPQNMTISGESVIVTDSGDGVVCIGSDCKAVKRELRDERLVCSCGVCVTDDGVVLVAGYESNNIVMFQENGKCIGELVSEDLGLNSPVSLCYVKKTNSVIVACENSNLLYVIQLSR